MMVEWLTPFKTGSHTTTIDNGKECSDHEKTAAALNMNIYFPHPYHLWERGLNENTNGLIRQYIPKGSSFHEVSDEKMQKIIELPDNQPCKSLGYRTPNEVFQEVYLQSG
jgi:transposase, IS30 family